MKQQSFFVIGGNCPRSFLELQTIFIYFETNGLKPVKKIKQADIICVYTCGGFNWTEESSIQIIHDSLKQKSKNATVIITGCLVKINPESMKVFQDIKDISIIDIDHLEQLDTIIHPKIPLKQIHDIGILGGIPPLNKDNIIKKIFLDLQADPNKLRYIPFYLNKIINDHYYKNKNTLDPTEIYHIRISRGCRNNCAHCAIKFAHRPLRSRPIDQIQLDIERGLKKGYTIFKFVGHDVSCYGMDINTNIVELLTMFFNLPGENKVILTDINPRWFMKYYDQLEPILIENHDKIISFRIPIESGSNKILTRMNRQYQIEDVKKYMSRLKEKIPTLNIKTHVIVGYPGETEEDFQQTIAILKEIQFSYVEVYPYSNRPMTEAYKMNEKNSPEVIERRRKQVIQQIYLTK